MQKQRYRQTTRRERKDKLVISTDNTKQKKTIINFRDNKNLYKKGKIVIAHHSKLRSLAVTTIYVIVIM